jgi:hypothetical protein
VINHKLLLYDMGRDKGTKHDQPELAQKLNTKTLCYVCLFYALFPLMSLTNSHHFLISASLFSVYSPFAVLCAFIEIFFPYGNTILIYVHFFWNTTRA